MSQTQFPKMGEEPLTNSLVNVSGNRSPYTTAVARKGPSGDSESEPATHRGQTSMSGTHPGPAFRPQTTISYPNAPEASQTGRGMRTLPSAVGNSPFWDRRADESGEVIG
jgi:hypothetical protein